MMSERVTSARVAAVICDAQDLHVTFEDGQRVSVPPRWYPRLDRVTTAQRAKRELVGAGFGVHWPEIDEDLSALGRAAPGVVK